MKILEKYILRENLKPFIVSLLVITFVLLLDHLIDLLNIIIEKRLNGMTIVQILVYSLPFLMAMSVPMSVLTASIMSFGRLSVDNEVTAFKSCGINVYTLLRPTVISAILLSIFMVYFNNQILPDSNYNLKRLRDKIITRKPISALKPGVFTEMERYTIYVKSHDDKYMRGIVIYDRSEGVLPQVITAEYGEINLFNGGNSLKAILYNGEMRHTDRQHKNLAQVRTFKKFTLNLPDLGFSDQSQSSTFRGDRELSSAAMREKIVHKKEQMGKYVKKLSRIINEHNTLANKENLTTEEKREQKKLSREMRTTKSRISDFQRGIKIYQVEIHKKYAIAFACLVFVLVGAPIGMMTRTSGVGMAFSVSSVVFLIYYISLYMGEELADRGYVPPWIAMWIANILLGVVGIFLIIFTVKESRFIDLNKYIMKVVNIFKRKKHAA